MMNCVSLRFVAVATVVISMAAGTAAAQPRERVVEIISRAIEARLTVWQTPGGKPVYVGHCRRARKGCQARIATFSEWIVDVGEQHRVDPFLLAAVAMRESGFDPFAGGGVGERGIVQLHPQGVGRGVRFVRSERYRQRCQRFAGACQREVLEVGARHLLQAIERCGTVEAGLGAYNAGECTLSDYSRRVMRERDRMIELAKERPAEPLLEHEASSGGGQV